MKRGVPALISLSAVLLMVLACAASGALAGQKSIVVTYSILGSIVKDLVGNQANIIVSIPNGLDPHTWEPSARDIEAINKAKLVIQNGLGLEGGMQKTLAQAQANGVKFFTASEVKNFLMSWRLMIHLPVPGVRHTRATAVLRRPVA